MSEEHNTKLTGEKPGIQTLDIFNGQMWKRRSKELGDPKTRTKRGKVVENSRFLIQPRRCPGRNFDFNVAEYGYGSFKYVC